MRAGRCEGTQQGEAEAAMDRRVGALRARGTNRLSRHENPSSRMSATRREVPLDEGASALAAGLALPPFRSRRACIGACIATLE
jgi:hypothetical protein